MTTSSSDRVEASVDEDIKDEGHEKNIIRMDMTGEIITIDNDDLQDKERSTDDIVDVVVDDIEEKSTENDVSKKDMLLYLLMGLVSDADLYYIGSPSMQKYIALPDFNVAPTAFAACVGEIVSCIIALSLLDRIMAEKIVSLLFVAQVMGILFMWFLPTIYNNIVGTLFLDFGMFGMLLVMLPLTFKCGIRASTMYTAGVTFSGLLGTGMIQLFDATGGGKTVHFLVLLVYPLITLFSFFGLDRSAFVLQPPTTITSEGMKSLEEKQEEQEINGQMNHLSMKDYWCAFKEIAPRYVPQIVLTNVFLDFWLMSINMPMLQSSTFTYAGDETEDALYQHEDSLGTVSTVIQAVIGTSLLTPLAVMIPTMSPYYLWIPTILVVVIVVTPTIGLLTGAFPPISVGWLVTFFSVFTVADTFFGGYVNLFLREDKVTSKKYQGIQVQMALFIPSLISLLTSTISMLWFEGVVLNGCISNYQEEYDWVNCTNYKGH